ncbi:hypothetical protein Kfla_4601 [Kribbella flavida DSM 17836]|uniref:Uncharacterized protein n=1 Tax=Kribbella flavida (strain DSM 17836 / JCM 10339 / NBRC 14399) TaxID=479435 RepID=D2PY13_KRIFD|nr:hypothetical protein [Kribbella flavida]ADB33619.1 hypothetical protein Kfla_4601 [Kribbella flavida DSM 17836]
MGDDDAESRRCRVRVWFGDHVVADYCAEAELAGRYAAAMTRRFAGLRVTSEPLSAADPGGGRPLPGERLWEVAPT